MAVRGIRKALAGQKGLGLGISGAGPLLTITGEHPNVRQVLLEEVRVRRPASTALRLFRRSLNCSRGKE